MKFNKFVPLAKMEEQADGTLLVFGIVTAEEPDLSNEVCDYNGTKPYYQAKVAEMAKSTSVEGMEKSIMPMREMHTLKAIGAGRTIEFDDVKKQIRMGFEVVDPVAIQKFKKGVLIGFSQGGAYVGDLIDDPVHKGCKRYVADPAEVSGVDAPCLPSALVDAMKGRTVTLAKASGETVEVTLQAPAKTMNEFTEMLNKATEHTVRSLLACGSAIPVGKRKAVLEAAEHVGVKLSDRDAKAVARTAAKLSLAKGLYEVGWLGDMIEQLHWLCLQTEFEREMEDDGSKVPEGLREAWMSLLAEFKAMAIEEADELAAQGGKGEKALKITDQAGLTKAAKTISDHLEKLHELHKAAGEAMEKHHEAVAKKHEAIGEHIEKCMKCAKDAAEGEEPEPAEKNAPAADDAVAKKFEALEKSLADMSKAHTELLEKLSKTPAPGQIHTGVLDDVLKNATPNPANVPAELAGIVNTAPAA